MFGNLGMPEILLILVVVLLIFGAKRLPEIGSALGKSVRELKRGLSDTSDAIMRNDEEQRNLTSR
ncbi:MAG TPA: twin-arginine translocase TatA/TatE family subunit, partial [Gemmatimonadales bacterium]|nr:twin-arginine translocase TatA/TatE family subunit [Gemmatimonadales bacterium]